MDKLHTGNTRFQVQLPVGYRQDGEWDDVGAPGGFIITDSGALVFYNSEGGFLVAYAPHSWSMVTAE